MHRSIMDVTMRDVTTPLRFETLPSHALDDVPAAADTDEDEGVMLVVQVPSRVQAAELADLMSVVFEMEQTTSESRRQVLRALLPEERLTVTPAVLVQLQRNAQAHADLAAEFGLLGSADVSALAGSTATNTAALASRWRQEGKIFGVDVHGTLRFPGFQFNEQGQPLPVIANILSLLPHLPRWELALWFTGGNGWLGGARPVDVLTSDPAPVLDAAKRLAGEIQL